MEPNTLYYTFSAIPQVLGTIAAIMAAFTHFRISALKQYLIGDGQSVLNRWGRSGYALPDPEQDGRQKRRLEDAIARNNVAEVKHVLYLLRNNEREQGITRKERPTGLQYVYEKFCRTEDHIRDLRRWTVCAIAVSFFTITVSILSLGLTDCLLRGRIGPVAVVGNVLLCLLSLGLSLHCIVLGFMEKTPHETEREFKEPS